MGSASGSAVEEVLLRGCALLDLFGSIHAPPPARHLASAFCRACALYYRPDGRLAAARVHALLLGRGTLLPSEQPPAPAGGLRGDRVGGLRCLHAVMGADGSLEEELGLRSLTASRHLPSRAEAAAAAASSDGDGGSGRGRAAVGRVSDDGRRGDGNGGGDGHLADGSAVSAYREACAAMELLGMSAEQKNGVWRAVRCGGRTARARKRAPPR